MIYPKWIYHKTEAPKLVQNEVEHDQAGEGWEETPAAFDKESNETPQKPTADKNEKTAIDEADFTKMTVAELKEFLISKGVTEEELKTLKKKDDLIAKVGAL